MKTRFFIPLLMVASLVSCNSGQLQYNKSYYIKTIEMTKSKEEGFRIVCLNDLHFGIMANLEEEFAYLDKLIDYKGGQDLIVLNGDVFHSASKEVIRRTFDYFDSKNVPYAYVYGNHDLEGQYSNSFINNELLKRKNSVLSNPKNDNVYGDSNYFVNIEKDGELYWQLHFFDSNTYRFLDYDVIHQNQIDWYRRIVEETTEEEGKIIPSLTFTHIPFREFDDAWKQYDRAAKTIPNQNGDVWTMIDTGVAAPTEQCNTYETMKELGSAKGVVVAHDHTNNSDFNYGGIRLIYGTKTGRNLYHNEKMMGACYYTLGIDQNGNVSPDSFKLERVNLTYKDEVPVDNTDLHLMNGGN